MARIRGHTPGIKIIWFKLLAFPAATLKKKKLSEKNIFKASYISHFSLFQTYSKVEYIRTYKCITYATIISAVRSVSGLVNVVLKELPFTIQYDFTVLSRQGDTVCYSRYLVDKSSTKLICVLSYT